jgi:WD40 repeat protein
VVACGDIDGGVSFVVAGGSGTRQNMVHRVHAHKNMVTGTLWDGHNICTSSSDGVARLLDVPSECMRTLYTLEGGCGIASLAVGGGLLYLGTSTGSMIALDHRVVCASHVCDLHGASIQRLTCPDHPSPLLASSCSDGSVKVWDIRQLSGGVSQQPIHVIETGKLCPRAVFAPGPSGALACLDVTLGKVRVINGISTATVSTSTFSHEIIASNMERWVMIA